MIKRVFKSFGLRLRYEKRKGKGREKLTMYQ